MAKEKKQCEHPGCLCMVDEDDDYCGAYCEGGADHPEITCECGHPGCAPD